MTYSIECESSAPCHADEADKERGREAFAAAIEASGLNPARLHAADLARGEYDRDAHPDAAARDVIERANNAAEMAVTEGWQDQTADSGVSYCIELDA